MFEQYNSFLQFYSIIAEMEILHLNWMGELVYCHVILSLMVHEFPQKSTACLGGVVFSAEIIGKDIFSLIITVTLIFY